MRVSWPNPVKLKEMLRQEDTKVKQPTKVKRYHLTETPIPKIDCSIGTALSLHHKIPQLYPKTPFEAFS